MTSQDQWDADEARYKAERDAEWEFFSGPFVSLDSVIAAVRLLDNYYSVWKYGVFPDPNTTTKWIIKRTWQQ